MSVLNHPLRAILTGLHSLLKLRWFVLRPRTFGAHALPITPEGKIVLVKLRYADGWRIPGGGRKKDERPEVAVVRELREEIGMTSHGTVERVCELDEQSDFKKDLASLMIVRDVRYRRPKWSLEIEDLMETEIDNLPGDLSPRAARWIEALLPRL